MEKSYSKEIGIVFRSKSIKLHIPSENDLLNRGLLAFTQANIPMFEWEKRNYILMDI